MWRFLKREAATKSQEEDKGKSSVPISLLVALVDLLLNSLDLDHSKLFHGRLTWSGFNMK